VWPLLGGLFVSVETADNTSKAVLLRAANPPRWVLLTLLCLALVVRGKVTPLLVDGPFDPDGYWTVANELVQRGGFATVSYGSRVLTAARPPLYPLCLAGLVYVCETLAVAVPIGFFHLALGMATIVAVWHLGRLWSLRPWASILGAALVTIDPIQLRYSAQIMTETLASLLATWFLIALTHWGRQPSLRRALVAGVCCGLCILCRPEFLAWAAVVVLAFAWAAIPGRRLSRLTVFAVAAALVVAPWPLRNARQFGSPIVTTTHGGITLLLANNPDFYEYLRSAPWGSTWDGESINIVYADLRLKHQYKQFALGTPMPWSTRPAIDEVAVDREAYQLAFKNIRAEPAMFAYSCLVRVGRLWAVLPHAISDHESPSRRGMRYAVGIFYAFELALAALGAWFLGRKLLREPWVWGTLLLASYTLVHAFYWTDMRMRAPLVPVVALLVAVAVSRLATKRDDATPLTADA
jgi:hypothetical protein